MDKKGHWDKVYQNKQEDQVSWFQQSPDTSLNHITGLEVGKEAALIDIGGGCSSLSQCLLNLGYTNLTVLDISNAAIARSKEKLGSRAAQVKFINSNVLDLDPGCKFDIWHDRATFHFLIQPFEIKKYAYLCTKFINPKGFLILATFSDQGPQKCSGLNVSRYSKKSLEIIFAPGFKVIGWETENHTTPSGAEQNFLWCLFQKN